MAHLGRPKLVNGSPLGRCYFGPCGYPSLSQSARAAAYPKSSIEFDMPNAVVHFATQLAEGLGLSLALMKKYVKHKDAWRKAVSMCLDMGLEDAKKMLLKASYGYAFPGRHGVCPLLDGLASEGLRLREAVTAAFPDLVEAMRSAQRPRPDTSAVAMSLMDLEKQVDEGLCIHFAETSL
jgi:hypothetical protein